MAKVNYISVAKKTAAIQISELKKITKTFDKSFVQAVELIANCKGKVIAAGIGKSGLIARKVAATLSSVGISSFFLNPNEANHGDLGQIDKRDLLLVFSYSGNTSEIANMLRYANRFNIKIIGIASKKDSLLLKASDVKLLLPQVKESDPTGMVPTTSTSITLLLGDCLAVALMNKMKFSKERFKVFHPGGNIGQTLLLVQDIMITGSKSMRVHDVLEMIKEMFNNKISVEYTNNVLEAHYNITPYTFKPKVAKKYQLNYYHDLGQGVLEQIHDNYEKLLAEGEIDEENYLTKN